MVDVAGNKACVSALQAEMMQSPEVKAAMECSGKTDYSKGHADNSACIGPCEVIEIGGQKACTAKGNLVSLGSS